MSVLFNIIKKNFKLLIRSKSSALIIILGPLLLIFLVGIAFDNLNKYSINIGTYSSSYSPLTESFIAKLQVKEYKVEKIESEELCIEQIKQGKLHTCIIFPPGLTLEPGKMNEIVFYVDYSKINLIWMVLDTLSTSLKERSSELSLDLTSNLLNKIDLAKKGLYDIKPQIVNLKTENQQALEQLDPLKAKITDARDVHDSMKAYFVEKITGAQAAVDQAKNIVQNSNASESQKGQINTKVSEINTYLLNMNSKLNEASNDGKETDWQKVTRLANEVLPLIDSLKQLLSSSSPKIDELQKSIDSLYSDLDSIAIKEAATIVSPVNTQIKPVIPEKTYLNYLFPSLIVLVVMFISILLATTLVQMEKHSPAYFRNFITPTRTRTFILGTFLTAILLVITQLAIILIISANFFKSQILPSLGIVIIALLIITAFFVLVGMLIGYLFKSEETATLASISTGSIFLFLSNLILPLESMPESVRSIAQYNPFVLAEGVLKKAIIFQQKFTTIPQELLYLGIASIILFVIILYIYKFSRAHTFHKLFMLKNDKKINKR